MSKVFNSVTPGTVAVYAIEGANVAVISMEPSLPTSNYFLLTGVGFDTSQRLQVMPSLQRITYIYNFGERPGSFQIKGAVFQRTCPQAGVQTAGMLGDLFTYYKSVARSSAPVRIAVGGGARPVVLTGVASKLYSTYSDSNTGTLGFTMDMVTVLAT